MPFNLAQDFVELSNMNILYVNARLIHHFLYTQLSMEVEERERERERQVVDKLREAEV